MRYKNRFLLWLITALMILTLTAGCGKKTPDAGQDPAESTVSEPGGGAETPETPAEDELEGLPDDFDPDAAGEDLELFDPEEADLSNEGAEAEDDGWLPENAPEPVSDPDEGTTLYEEGPPPAGYEENGELPESAAEIAENTLDTTAVDAAVPLTVEKNGTYTSKEEVALYIHTYGKLPSNFISKKKAESLGWKTESYDLDEVAPGKSIGGSYFGNYEGVLPPGDYRECDIDYHGGSSRGAKRIVYSSDGRIYYTDDHYETFEQLY